MAEQKVEKQKFDFKLNFDLPLYNKLHAVIGSNLTDQFNIFDRELIGISLREADKIYTQCGCKTVEDYMVRLALNDEAFTSQVT